MLLASCENFSERATEIWRRVRLEFTVELPLLKKRWAYILCGAIFQYVHGLGTQLAHRMHRPQKQPLHDVGFALLPELGLVNEWVSELIFTTLFVSFMTWTFSPFVTARKRFYTAVIWSRLLMVLVVCQSLRIASFSVTQLPAPNYHCRSPAPTAIKAMPAHWWGHLYIQNLQQQSTHGCGDLIFSSHTTFMLTGMLTYNEYGTQAPIKALAWAAVAVVSFLIVASRKHYSVDVLIAWYVVPLVFHTMLRRWTTKRPAVPHWPHRPLAEDAGSDSEAGGDRSKGAAQLQQILVVDGVARQTEMVAQKQSLLAAMPASDTLAAAAKASDRASNRLAMQAALDKEVLLSEGELTDSESEGNGNGNGSGGSMRLKTSSGSRGALMRPRSQAGPLNGNSGSADRDESHMTQRRESMQAGGSTARSAPATMLAPSGLGSSITNNCTVM